MLRGYNKELYNTELQNNSLKEIEGLKLRIPSSFLQTKERTSNERINK